MLLGTVVDENMLFQLNKRKKAIAYKIRILDDGTFHCYNVDSRERRLVDYKLHSAPAKFVALV